jgi:hypothetical protein
MQERRPVSVRPSRLHRDLLEGEVAAEMVARGAASTMRVSGLRYGERVAPLLAVSAQQWGVAFRIERSEAGPPVLVFGPRLARRTPA